MKKNKKQTLSSRVKRISAGVAAVGKNYEKHAREVGAFTKKIKGEWKGAQRKTKR